MSKIILNSTRLVIYVTKYSSVFKILRIGVSKRKCLNIMCLLFLGGGGERRIDILFSISILGVSLLKRPKIKLAFFNSIKCTLSNEI